MARSFKILLISVCVLLLLTACAGNKDKNAQPAVADLEKVMAAHPLYGEYQKVNQSIKALEYARERQVKTAGAHMSGLDQLVQKNQENREKFDEALFNAKLSEIDTAVRFKLMEKRADLLGDVQERFRDREQAIYDKYKLDIFNTRNKLQMLRMDYKRRGELTKQLAELEQRQNRELAMLNEEKNAAIRGDLAGYEAQYRTEFEQQALQIRDEILGHSERGRKSMDEKLSRLSKELEDTVINLDKELANLQNRKELIYNKIHSDIELKAAQIAKTKNYGIIFTDVKVNIRAADITEQLREAVSKK